MANNDITTLPSCNKCGKPVDTPFCGLCGANQRDPREVKLIAFHAAALRRNGTAYNVAMATKLTGKPLARVRARLNAAHERCSTLAALLAEVGRPIQGETETPDDGDS